MKQTTGVRLVALVVLGVSACARPSGDEELRRFVDDAAAAAEGRDTSFFRGVVGASYFDAAGNDRDRIIDLIRGYFLINSEIEADVDLVGVEWSGTDSVKLVLDARIDGNIQRITRHLELELLRDGSQWNVIGAHWAGRNAGSER